MFSEEMGLVPEKPIQIKELDARSRVRIWNFIKNIDFPEDRWKYVVDKIGKPVEDKDIYNYQVVEKLLNNSNTEWYVYYDVLEILHDVYSQDESAKVDYSRAYSFQTSVNNLMKELRTEYKMQNGRFIRIGCEMDGEEIETALNTPTDVVRDHLNKAVDSYSRRDIPDYANTERESIMALESLSNVLVGKKLDLNKAIDEMEKRGKKLHSALKDAIKKLYAYASDEDGVRHGGIDVSNVNEEEARLIMVVSSAVVNFMVARLCDDNQELRAQI